MKSANHIFCIKNKKLLKRIQQYNEFNKGIMQKWILYLWILKIVKHLTLTGYYSNLTHKIDLRQKDKYIAISNLSIYYTWKNIKKSNKNNKFKVSAPTWNGEFELPDGSNSISDIQDTILNF